MSDLEKIALFINGPNLHHTARRLGFDVDFKRLLARFGQYGSLVRAYYYTVVDEGGGPPGIKPLADWLDYNGFTVRSKLSKVTDDGQGRRKIRRRRRTQCRRDRARQARHSRLSVFGRWRLALARGGTPETRLSGCTRIEHEDGPFNGCRRIAPARQRL